MQKQAPSIGRILVAVGFTLSCFGLLLFLWVTFGGPVPFKPESYRFTADFPEAITLQKEADVRIGGVSVGKVKDIGRAPESECDTDPTVWNTTQATIEIDPQYAPISSDAKAILRQKTLLGETYIEITSGSQVQPGDTAGNVRAQSSSIDVGQVSGSDAPQLIPRAGTWPRRRSRTRPRSTRSSKASTSPPARRSSPGCRTRAWRSTGAAST